MIADCRFRILSRRAALAGLLLLLPGGDSGFAQGIGYSLRFFGNGAGDIDRVKIRIDAPEVPADIGAGDFTLEFWMRANSGDNRAQGCRNGADNWITGNIIIDRDINGAGDLGDYGISLFTSGLAFGAATAASGAGICGATPLADGRWHHVAATRSAATGELRLYVDGRLDAAGGGPRGDISYRNGRAGSANDPYLVIGAEKHDAGPAYPSFRGWVDELRLSNAIRYSAEFTPPDGPFEPDGSTAALYHFDEGRGAAIYDDSGAAGGPSDGVLRFGGSPAGPLWTTDTPFGPLPPGFQRSVVATGLDEPTSIEFAPGGRLFIGERGGGIRVVDGGVLLPDPVVTVRSEARNEERGLAGIALDPDFARNGFLYIHYTTTEPRNRVERFTVAGNTADPSSARTIWENPQRAAAYHHGGAIEFGPDGNLYIATGDQGSGSLSQDLSNQHGKILRLRPDGSIPLDNPFRGVAGAQEAVWAYGLRNPFRLAFDPETGELWIGDVGGNSSDSWEEVNRGIAGANYGWPEQEGPRCSVPDCSRFVFPVYSYQHNHRNYYITQPQGSITLGPVYRERAFPEEYRGNIFVGDFANRWIRRLVLAADGSVERDPLFLAPPGGGTIVDLAVGPEGALYFATFGLPTWISGSPDGGAVYRITYSGGGNRPPVAVASAEPARGPVPLTVRFSSAGTFDPDGGPDALAYAWSFGDGGASDQPHPVHTYTAPGPFTARLRVSDGASEAFSDPISIAAGDPPRAAIIRPPPGTLYRAGDVIAFAGEGIDPDDGPLGAAAFSWRVLLRHADHVHPFLGPIAGVEAAQFSVPARGHSPENTRFEVELTVTDSSGLTDTETLALSPQPSTILLDTRPGGIPVFLDGEAMQTPREYRSLIGFEHTVEAQERFVSAGILHVFRCWSDGGGRAHAFTAPEGGASLTAHYVPSPDPVSIAVRVPAADRNADYSPPFGERLGNFYDASGLCAGRDDRGHYQTALAFPLPIPRGAAILQAAVDVTATGDQAGSPAAEIRAYRTGSAAPFDPSHTHSLTAHHPVSGTAVRWDFPAFVSGRSYRSPDLAALVEEVVNRTDWSPGGFLGLVIDGEASASGSWRCLRNFQSGDPPEITVVYAVPAVDPGGDCPAAGTKRGWKRCDFNCDGAPDISDAVAGLEYLFGAGAGPCCRPLADCNGDGEADIADWVFLLLHLFRGDLRPPAPYPSCGAVLDEDCAAYPHCGEAAVR